MQALYRQRGNVKALGGLHGSCVEECVSVHAPAEIYCNVSEEVCEGLKALTLID